MDSNVQEKLRPLLDAVKLNPQDPWTWMQLGGVSKLLQEWNTAFCAYLTATRIAPDEQEFWAKFCQIREEYIKSKAVKDDAFYLETFRLPQHTAVLLMIGLLNTDIKQLQQEVKNLIAKGFHKIILDFTGLYYISGLGPSCLRNLQDDAGKQGKSFIIACQKDKIRDILRLKGILIPEYPDLREAFKA